MASIISLDQRQRKRSRIRSALWHLRHRVPGWPLSLFRLRLPRGGDDVLFSYPVDSAVGRCLWMGGYELAELRFFSNRIEAGQVVIDIGANGGLYSMVGARMVGKTGRVICVEPGTRERDLLAKNVSRNAVDNVSIHALALSNQNGEAKFAISQDGAMNSLASTAHPLQKVVQWDTVTTRRLDTFVTEQSLSHVDFIKLDVEGAEQLVIEGASETLNANEGITVLFEASDVNAKAFGHTTRGLVELFQSMKFNIYSFEADGGLAPVTSWRDDYGAAIYNFVATRRPLD